MCVCVYAPVCKHMRMFSLICLHGKIYFWESAGIIRV